MGLVDWFRGKKEDLERSLATKALTQVNAWGSARWPAGWLRFKRALSGWKTIIGIIVFNTPEFLGWLGQNLPGIMGAFGQEAEAAAPLIKTIGGILAFVGLVHKWIKFMEPVERREAERIEKVVQIPLRSASGESIVEVPLTKLEAQVFVAEEAKRRDEDGDVSEQDRIEAVKTVKPEVVVIVPKVEP